MGDFLDRLGRAFSFIGEAVRMGFRDTGILIPSALSLVAQFAYVAIIFLVLSITGSLWLIGMDSEDVERLRATGRFLREGPGAALERTISEEVEWQASLTEEVEAATARGDDPQELIDRRRLEREEERAAAAAERERRREAQTGRRYWQAVFSGGGVFGALLISYIFSAMTVSLVHDHLCGKSAHVGKAARVVMRRFGSLVLLAVVSTIISVLAGAARGKKGSENAVGAIVAGIIESIWTVASFLILPGMVIHRLSLWQGLTRAKEIASKNLLVVAVGEVAVGLVANFIALAGVMAGMLAGFFTWRALPHPFYIPVGVTGVIALVAISFAMFVRHAYYTCLYLNAVETAKLGRRAPARGPLAAALA